MPTPVKTEPNKVDEQLIYLVGRGYTSLKAGEKMGLSRAAVRQRMRSLKDMTGSQTQAAMVYWMLNEYRIEYSRRWRKVEFDDLYLKIIERVAWGWNFAKISKALYVSPGGVHARVRDARLRVGAKSQAHLVAICWTEDWIV